MAIKKGQKVRVTCLDGKIYEGVLRHICLGISKEEPTQASIILKEEESDNMRYIQAHLWCNSLKNIEVLE